MLSCEEVADPFEAIVPCAGREIYNSGKKIQEAYGIIRRSKNACEKPSIMQMKLNNIKTARAVLPLFTRVRKQRV
jgi:hypothetical protein